MDSDSLPLSDPADIVAAFRAQHPGRIEMALDLHNAPGYAGTSWPQHVFVPSRLVEAGFWAQYGYVKTEPDAGVRDAIAMEAGFATALAAWSIQQAVFVPDDELLEAFHRAPPQSAIPVGALRNLPAWCVYVELPRPWWLGRHEILGAFAHLDTNEHGEDEHLQVLWNAGSTLLPCPLPLGGSIEDSIRELAERTHAFLVENGDREAAEAFATPGRIYELIGSPELIGGLVNALTFLGTHGLPDGLVDALDRLVA